MISAVMVLINHRHAIVAPTYNNDTVIIVTDGLVDLGSGGVVFRVKLFEKVIVGVPRGVVNSMNIVYEKKVHNLDH